MEPSNPQPEKAQAIEAGAVPLIRPLRRMDRVPAGLPADVSLPRLVAALAIWPLLEQCLNFLVGFVDTALAGHLSVAATSAVGAASYILWLMGLLQGAIGVGATAIIARSIGYGNRHEANEALAQALLAATLWGLFIGIVFYLTAPWVATITGLQGEALELAVVYLRLLALAAPAASLLFIAAACLRGAGDTRSPFFIMVVVNIVNTSVSLLLVVAPAPIGGHGLRGIALGTVAAWSVGVLLILRLLLRGRSKVHLIPHNLPPRPHMLWRLVRIGAPNLLENSGQWVGNFLVLIIVGHMAADHFIGAHIIAIRVEAISFLPGVAMGITAATLAGQYLGAEDPHTARKAVWLCWTIGAALMTFMGVLFILIPDLFVRLVTDQQEFLDLSPRLLTIAGYAQIGFATYLVLSGALRGAGDTRSTMLMTYSSTFLVRLPLAYLLGVTLGYGLTGLWVALAFELLFRGVIFLARFLHGGWTRVKV